MKIYKWSSKKLISFLFLFYIIWYTTFPSMSILLVLVGLMLVLIDYNRAKVPKEFFYFIIVIFFYYNIFLAFDLYLYGIADMGEYIVEIKKNIFMVLILFVLIFSFLRKQSSFFKLVDLLLTFFLGFWILQTLLYYSTGYYLDPLLLVGKEQKYAAYIFRNMGVDLIRATSLFNEPGSYATFTYVLLAISYYYHGNITKLHKVVLVSYFASLSLFAMIIGVLFLMIDYLSKINFKKTKKLPKTILIATIVFIALYYFFDYYITYRFEISTSTTGGMDQREELYMFWAQSDIYQKLLGFGRHNSLADIYSIDDNSLLFKIIFESGLVGLSFIAVIFIFLKRLKAILLFSILLITKMSYLYFGFILLPFGLMLVNYQNHKRSKE